MPRRYVLEFEKPLAELVQRVKTLKSTIKLQEKSCEQEIRALERQIVQRYREIFMDLTPWQQTELARHPNRAYMLDYVLHITEDFLEIHGDRCFGEDPAIVAGLAVYHGLPVVMIGHQKGRGTAEKVKRNFGMPNPEGYRKALRAMELASRFGKPIVTFIDTPGAFCGKGAEERGQAEAIARNLVSMSRLPVPIIAVITGEGGSGGALGISVADRILVQEHAIYSVISPEGCAAILWKSRAMAPTAAECLKLTATDLLRLDIADDIIREPLGGAHRNHKLAALLLDQKLLSHLKELCRKSVSDLLRDRYDKYRRLGEYLEIGGG